MISSFPDFYFKFITESYSNLSPITPFTIAKKDTPGQLKFVIPSNIRENSQQGRPVKRGKCFTSARISRKKTPGYALTGRPYARHPVTNGRTKKTWRWAEYRHVAHFQPERVYYPGSHYDCHFER
jgi:hypothetical protein